MNLKIVSVLCMLAMSLTSLSASAGYWDRGGRSRGPGHGGGHGHHHYYSWQYDGQAAGPIHGSPYGINYCGTEYPQQCYQYGAKCYVNNGYWWDNSRQVNWFNTFRCM